MEFSAGQISELLGGKVEGKLDTCVNALSKIEEGKRGSLSFLANPKYEHYLYQTDASIVIVDEKLKLEKAVKEGCTLIRVKDPYAAFGRLLQLYNEIKNDKKGIDPHVFISESANFEDDIYFGSFVFIGEKVVIGKNVKIFPNTFIGDNVKIDDNTTIFAGCKIYSETIIGKNCIIHAGTTIGADGFGFVPNDANNYEKVPQIGNVVIENSVEIGANSCIDRATLGSTRIGSGVKIDNLVQIAHNVEVGQNTVIAAQTGIAGSTKIGKNCMIGGQVGIVGHIIIADNVKIAAQSGIGQSITEKGKIVQGSPAFGIGDYKRAYVGFTKLPEILNNISQLQKEVQKLKVFTDKNEQ